MEDHVSLSLDRVRQMATDILLAHGLSQSHAIAVAASMTAAQRDECHSHGVFRLPGCVELIRHGKIDPRAVPVIDDRTSALLRVDARYGYSLLAFQMGMPLLVEKTRKAGVAVMAINNCYHFSALWPEVEALTEQGLVALIMTQGVNCVAPAGGYKPTFGTNPIAFGWPRPGGVPYVFDFATSAIARGDIELHQLAAKDIPLGWALDHAGKPTTDAGAALAGALLTFGGHKGSALSTMVELLTGPMIGDLTSAESRALDNGAGYTPLHGELILTLDPAVFLGADATDHFQRAEQLFALISGQGARLPSERRYEARKRSLESGMVSIPANLYQKIQALMLVSSE